MTDRPRAVAAVLLTAGVSLGVLVAAALVVGALAFAAPGAASSAGFYWTSAAVAVLVQVPAGGLAARLAAPRLRRAGVTRDGSVLVLSAAAPAVLALLANLRPIEDVPPVVSTVLPACAAVLGAMLGARVRLRRRADTSLY